MMSRIENLNCSSDQSEQSETRFDEKGGNL